MKVLTGISIFVLALATGCNQSPDKTREQAAQATEKVKAEGKAAGIELKKEVNKAAEHTKAAVEGVKQGWQAPDKPVNVNSASKIRLETLPGVDGDTADRIIAGRPYRTRDSLRSRHVLSADQYAAIRDKVVTQ
ncbi:MAG TPA: helix-hairpin-helix domain-containing protein [Candidatus Angelobacter sp.]|nr:helix-hairpin-helix domain-containing protein [Candidatus Angelobacter sp.]